MTFPRSIIAVVLLALIFIAWYVWKSSPSQWLEAKIEEYNAQEVWKFQHNGQTAYFFLSGCCDQYNPVFNASGKFICSPSGGYEGDGDQKCPWPADRGTNITLVWPVSNQNPNRSMVAPQLSKP